MDSSKNLIIKNVIKEFKQAEKEVSDNIVRIKSFLSEEEKFWNEIPKLDNSILIDHRMIALLGDSLQLIDNKDRLKLVDLQDRKQIYQLVVDHYPDNIQYQEDLVAFVYNVLDDEAEALLLIEKFERRVEITRTYFNEMKREAGKK